MIVNSKVLAIIKDFILEYGWSFWLGWGLGMLFHVGISDIRFWIFIIPMVILVALSKRQYRKEIDKKIEKNNIANGQFFVGNKKRYY